MVLKRSTVPPISGKLIQPIRTNTLQSEPIRHKGRWGNVRETEQDSATCATKAREKDGAEKDDAGKNGGSECGTNFNLCQEWQTCK